MARSRRRTLTARGPNRNLFWARHWGNYQFGATEPQSAQVSDLISGFESVYGADLFGFTVTRIVGHLWADLSLGSTNYSTSLVSWGFRVANKGTMAEIDQDPEEQAVSFFNDPYADWMYGRNVKAEDSAGATHYRQDVDIKSQRKLSELGQSLYGILYVRGIDAQQAIPRAGWDLSILLKQP